MDVGASPAPKPLDFVGFVLDEAEADRQEQDKRAKVLLLQLLLTEI